MSVRLRSVPLRLAGATLAVILAPWAGIGCAADVPDQPTYFRDVQPILRARCVRCHGGQPIDPAVRHFRLDRFVAGDDDALDVADMAPAIIEHTVGDAVPAMPPDYPLTERQLSVLASWRDDGFLKGTRSNDPPQLELVNGPTDGAVVGDQVEVVARVWDPDGDGVIARFEVRASVPGTTAQAQAEPGVVSLDENGAEYHLGIDTRQVSPRARLDLVAILDDGFHDDPDQNRHEIDIARGLVVDHGDGAASGIASSSFGVSDPERGLTGAAGTSGLGWDDVRPFFETYCWECHRQPPKHASTDYFRLDKYDASDPVAPINDDLGVHEMRELINEKLVVTGEMPPDVAAARPTAAEIALIAQWLSAGAPR